MTFDFQIWHLTKRYEGIPENLQKPFDTVEDTLEKKHKLYSDTKHIFIHIPVKSCIIENSISVHWSQHSTFHREHKTMRCVHRHSITINCTCCHTVYFSLNIIRYFMVKIKFLLVLVKKLQKAKIIKILGSSELSPIFLRQFWWQMFVFTREGISFDVFRYF